MKHTKCLFQITVMMLFMAAMQGSLIGKAAAESEVFTQDKIEHIISQTPSPHSIRIAQDPLDPGNPVVRFEVRKGDIWPSDVHRGMLGVERAELSEPEFCAPFRTDLWYRFRVLIPEESTDQVTRCLIAQWHATPDIHLGEVLRSPVLGIEIRGKEFLIRKCHSSVKVQFNNKENNKKRLYKSSEFIQKNVWHSFIINLAWSWEDDGYCRVWIDDRLVVDYKGPIGYNDDKGPYFKTGIYRDTVSGTHILYLDGYERGSTAAEIDFRQ